MNGKSDRNYKSLYDMLLDDNAYYKIYSLLERINKKQELLRTFMSATTYTELDGLHLRVDRENARVYNYSAYAIQYSKRTDNDPTRTMYPNYIVHDGMLGSIGCTPLHYTIEPVDFDPEDGVIFFRNAYLDSTDHSDKLFQFSLLYDTLSEEDIRTVITRLYNLPMKKDYIISFNSSLLHLDRLDDLDLLL